MVEQLIWGRGEDIASLGFEPLVIAPHVSLETFNDREADMAVVYAHSNCTT